LYVTHDNYAIVLVSGKQTNYYLHNKNETKLIKSITVKLPGQHKTGGYSAARFGRIRDGKIGLYVIKIIEMMIRLYTSDGKFNAVGLIMAGPAQMKDQIQAHDLFMKYFSNHVKQVVTIAEITDQSIYQVLSMVEDLEQNKIEDHVTHFYEMLDDPGKIDLIVFGIDDVLTLLVAGDLAEIYVDNKSIHKDPILNMIMKTKVHIVYDQSFVRKFGELVGVRFFGLNLIVP